MAFAGAMKAFFGLQATTYGDGIQGFVKELKALTPADKVEFHRELNRIGIVTDLPTTAQAKAA